jgi:hypothetical protein
LEKVWFGRLGQLDGWSRVQMARLAFDFLVLLRGYIRRESDGSDSENLENISACTHRNV